MFYNFHNEKYKTTDVGGIHKEQFREMSDESKYRNNVNAELSDQNVYQSLSNNGTDWFARIKEAKQSTESITGRSLRKDAVVLCSTVESVPQTWPQEASTDYFKAKAEWYGTYLHQKAGVDEGSMLSLVIHFDETTPHATYSWLPQKDGRLQAKNVLTKSFLQDLQKDSQEYTLKWIDSYNQTHPDNQIEPLERSGQMEKRQHLNELDYKVHRASQRVEQLEQQEAIISEDIQIASERLDSIRQETDAQLDIQRVTETKTAVAEEKYAAVVEKMTGAPDLASYESVVEENNDLKKELSFKDRVIEKLQEEVVHLQSTLQQWKEAAETWKNRFLESARGFGQRLMSYAGYDLSQIDSVPEYPSREIAEGIKSMNTEMKSMDDLAIRIVSDNVHPGQYAVVFKNSSGEYEILKDGLANRETAEDWRRNFNEYSAGISESMNEGMHHSFNV